MKRPNNQKKLGRPFKKVSGDTKTQIIETALDLFAAHGYAGTSVRQIARAVGISESGIYAHFEGKRHIYDTLFAETGPPVVMDKLISGELATFKNEPQKFLRELGEQVIGAWDEPRARQFMSVFMREGAIGTAEGSSSLASVVEQVQKSFGEFFRHWMDEGLVRNDFSPEHLVWEMISPLANVRFLYLHAQANEEERQTGLALAKRHIDYFITCVLTPHKANLPKKIDSGKNKKPKS
ncbi:MAG: TetR/AcrR family transcriptional regulator [Acidobacteria bacterium]|nr:TetR/AcrR family transcriptional regulator [Acidobacteriota bacterium]